MNHSSRDVGVTALVVRALVRTGESEFRPQIELAVRYLLAAQATTTTEVSHVIRALCDGAASHRSVPGSSSNLSALHSRIQKLADSLEEKQILGGGPGSLNGGWAYPFGSGDIVNSQAAVAALMARKETIGTFSRSVLEGAYRATMALREPEVMSRPTRATGSGAGRDRGFQYTLREGGTEVTGPRTLAGCVTIALALKMLDPANRPKAAVTDVLLEAGRSWETYHRLAAERNGGVSWYYFLMLLGEGLELPACCDHGRREEVWGLGATALLKVQSRQGFWDGQGVASTAMAVLYLWARLDSVDSHATASPAEQR